MDLGDDVPQENTSIAINTNATQAHLFCSAARLNAGNHDPVKAITAHHGIFVHFHTKYGLDGMPVLDDLWDNAIHGIHGHSKANASAAARGTVVITTRGLGDAVIRLRYAAPALSGVGLPALRTTDTAAAVCAPLIRFASITALAGWQAPWRRSWLNAT